MTEGKRKTSLLNEVLERRMAVYALAAGAALAGASGTQAKVVFTPSTAKVTAKYQPLNIDLNHDGVVDFVVGIESSSNYYVSELYAVRQNANLDAVAEVPCPYSPIPCPTAFAKGAQIGNSGSFGGYALMAANPRGMNYPGNFVNVANRYLGVRFLINGEIHYGWVGFRKVQVGRWPNHLRAALGGWAYEDQPNTPIIAGDTGRGEDDSAALIMRKPTSLELLAMGHTAIADRQRRMMGA